MNNDGIGLLVIASVWPHVANNFEAANVISHSIVSQLAALGDYELYYAYINTSSANIPAGAKPEIDALKKQGVQFLEPLLLPSMPSLHARPKAFLKALLKDPACILAGYSAHDKLQALLNGKQVDAVLSIWSEIGLNAASEFPALRFAYHGNPDHKVFEAQHEVLRLTGVAPTGVKAAINAMRRKFLCHLLERAHLSALRRYDFVADVAANDAAYYVQNGVKAVYLQNMWPQLPPADWKEKRDQLEIPGKMVGSVGNLSATGNSLGFIALAQEVLPALKKELGDTPFEIHIFGGSKLKPSIAPLLADPHIRIRGFVEDLDGEIMSAPVFLISNNHHTFKVGHTRFLHAWSLGACVVAFNDCQEAMPEIEHNKNALLGSNANEIAALVAQAMADHELRRRIGAGGIETLKNSYSPAAVTHKLNKYMSAFFGQKTAAA